MEWVNCFYPLEDSFLASMLVCSILCFLVKILVIWILPSLANLQTVRGSNYPVKKSLFVRIILE